MTSRAAVVFTIGFAGGFIGSVIAVTVVRARRLHGSVSQWLNLPMRYSWESRSDWARDTADILWDRASHKVSCRLGNHQAKFGSWPLCIWCGKDAR